MLVYESVPSYIRKLSLFALCMLGFGLPWSTGLFRLSIPLIFMVFLSLLYLAIKQNKQIGDVLCFVLRQRFVILAGLFVIWVVASLAWTEARMDYYKQDTWRYLKLLMVPVLAVLVRATYPNKGYYFIVAYIAGVLVLIIPSAFDGLGLFNYIHIDASRFRDASYKEADFVYFRNHIVHGFEVSVLAGLSLSHALIFVKRRILFLNLSIIAFMDVLFWTHGRMALISIVGVLVFVGISFFEHQKSEKKNRYSWVILFGLLFLAVIWMKWGNNSSRLESVFHETQKFIQEGNYLTSAGTRLHFWKISLIMFNQSWLTGVGSGGFSQYLEMTKDFYFNYGYSHAHNEYLSILSQYGLVGFALFVGCMVSLFQMAVRHGDLWLRKAMPCVLMVFMVNALSDSSLYNLWEGWTVVYFSAILLGTYRVD